VMVVVMAVVMRHQQSKYKLASILINNN